MLRDLPLPPQMTRGTDDIAGDFYLPCMQRSIRYDRVAGYFSSGVYLVAWPAMRAFVARGGRIRLICSPAISSADATGLELGYLGRNDAEVAAGLSNELATMLADDRLRKPTQALAGLVAAGIVEFRLAFLRARVGAGTKRIFHDKVGVFSDAGGDRVGFRGTMNETYLGLSNDGNLDSIDIFPSWAGGRDTMRLVDAEERFDALWRDEVDYARVVPFPDLTLAELRRIAEDAPWEMLADELAAASATPNEIVPETTAPRSLRPHQERGLAAWVAAGRRGILEHATGSGKTTTALAAVRSALAARQPVLVIVPSELLLTQWADATRTQLVDLEPRVLLCGAGNDEWRTKRLLRPWLLRGDEGRRLTISVVNTACSSDFLAMADGVGGLLVVADEVHRLGSGAFSRVFQLDATDRLGLSATVSRAGDPGGTRRILDYFEAVVDRYTLADGIGDGLLTPYVYTPHAVALSASEEGEWQRLTARIRRRYAQVAASGAADDPSSDESFKRLLMQRARLVKRAQAKVRLAGDVLEQNRAPGQRWLVYCDSRDQLRGVLADLRARGISAIEYHSAMEGDQKASLRDFEVNGGVVVAIHCLDEGVDIPAATHALILASSRNPREFVQRRGRVLRLHEGKSFAHIHDALVVPSVRGAGDDFDAMVWAELARGMEFARSATNADAATALERVCVSFGLDVERLAELGFEVDAADPEAD